MSSSSTSLFTVVDATATTTGGAVGGGRNIVSFDFNWKFRKGLHKWPDTPYEQPPINPDPGVNPPEASIDYDDDELSNWLDVQLPHDGLIVSF